MKIKDKNPIAVKGFSITECPTSYITPESVWILELTAGNCSVARDAGGTLFGPDSSKWPAWWMDALTAVDRAEAAFDQAVNAAMSSK